MKKTKFFICCFIIISILGKAQKPLLQWAKNIGGNGNNIGDPIIAVDNSGNIYSTCFFNGTVDFDPNVGVTNLTSAGGDDAFISKSDNNGNLIWVKSFGGLGNTYCRGIVLDGSGNIYISGYYSDTTDFDPNTGNTSLISLGGTDAFISKLDGNGNLIWAKSMGGTSNELGISIAVDASGNIISTGTYSGTADFDPGAGISNLTSTGVSDIFVVKLDAAGNFIWAKSMGGSSNDFPGDMNIDVLGNIYTTGQYEGTADFDPSGTAYNLTSSGMEDVFISKLDGAGNFIWAKSIGGISTDISYGINIDLSGKIYATGYYTGTVDFDPNAGVTNLTSAGGDDIFVLKLDNNGNLNWAKSMGGSGLEYGKKLVVDNSGNVYSAGLFNATADFDPNGGVSNLVPNGIFDVFISKLDTGGNFVWAKSMGGADMEWPTDIILDNSNAIYTAGKFAGIVDFDPNTGIKNITSNGTGDAFIHKMIQCNIKSLGGAVSGSTGGNVVLYQYIPTLSKWDSVAFTPYSSGYSFGLIDSSSYVIKAVPTATNEQVTYFGNAISWQSATVVNHGCMSNSTNTISIATFTNIGGGTGSMSGKIVEANGFGDKPTIPGNPIGGIIVKGGRNPGGQMFSQTTTDPVTGTYTLTGIPNGTNYFILVDIPGLDTNLTYHVDLLPGNNQLTGLDFTVDSIFVNPSPNWVGIHDLNIQEYQLVVFPNPTSDQIHINYVLKENSTVSIELVDIAGRSVKTLLPATTQHIDHFKKTFQLTDLNSGMYFIKLKINGNESIIKMCLTN